MLIINTETQLRNALDKLTQQDFTNHDSSNHAELTKIVCSGLKSEIYKINNMINDESEKLRYRDLLKELISLDINAHIKLFEEVMDNLLFYLKYKTEGVYELLNRLFPFDN